MPIIDKGCFGWADHKRRGVAEFRDPPDGITRQLEIIPGPIMLNTSTGRYAQTIRVESPTSVSYAGPTSFGFIGLPPTVNLLAPSGATLCSDTPQGTAFITSNLALGPVSQIYFQVQFLNPEATPIVYTPSVLAGTGQR